MAQLRADNFADAVLGSGSTIGTTNDSDTSGSGSLSSSSSDGAVRDRVQSPIQAQAQVLVTVPVYSMMGLTEEPAMLDGYGPIPASMARRLVEGGAKSFYRVLVDPRDGAPLEIGRTSYRVTGAMRAWLRMRDGKCPFPGCSNSSLDNDADHILAWHNGGTTGISNLGQPCRKHHRLRHTTRLDLTHRPPLPKRTPGLGTTPLAPAVGGAV